MFFTDILDLKAPKIGCLMLHPTFNLGYALKWHYLSIRIITVDNKMKLRLTFHTKSLFNFEILIFKKCFQTNTAALSISAK